MNPFLSIVIPAYNEENRLPITLEQVFHFLDKQPFTSEILVVENGSNDQTFEIAQQFASRHPNVHILRNEQRGKGLAIQHGV
ncbi:MAG TPA: glycosyltransferase, partial [Anaerolineales bacterium]|nr:glycosyltransferase [Anaerolineales bacterium]